MPSKVSMKIAAAYFDGAANEMMINGLAYVLDKFGVGDAFEAARIMQTGVPGSVFEAGHLLIAALRKAGMV